MTAIKCDDTPYKPQLQEVQNKRSSALMQVVVRCLHLLSLEKVSAARWWWWWWWLRVMVVKGDSDGG